jgi:aspartate 1-decarboxylase
MNRSMLKSKIHRAVVTEANVDYEGSLTVDLDLMEAADILPFEEVHVWNVSTGARFHTYAIAGERGSGIVCANGGAAHHAKPGQLLIVATFAVLSNDEARRHQPRVVHVDQCNRIRCS